jgi:hypothetical protein
MKFSDRMGVTKPALELYVDSMPSELKTSLWNFIYETCQVSDGSLWGKLIKLTARDFRKFDLHDLPTRHFEVINWMKDYFYSLTWYEVYNYIEFFAANYYGLTHGNLGAFTDARGRERALISIQNPVNFLLEREFSGYRFIAGVLIPIADKVELSEVTTAVVDLRGYGLDGARIHIKTALELFSKRPSPDYRNSIKEAISAIESICKLLGENKGSGIDIAIRTLEQKTNIHGSLRVGFEKMYGYTSDENGIRHGMLDDPNVGFPEAKYMIVACSAFANYLAAKADAAGLLKVPLSK